jgi:drug/metabolite transporter (DMT)-like permease
MRNVRAYLGVGLGVVTVSTAATLIRLAQGGMHSLTIAAWRLTLASLVLAPIALVLRRAELAALTRREWTYALGAGLLLALHFASWITSLAYTSVAASVVLVTINPIFVGMASFLWMRERLSTKMILALVIAISGSVMIGIGDLGEGVHRMWGDILALGGALAASGYFIIGRQVRVRLSLLAYVFPVYCMAALVLILIVILLGLPVFPQQPQIWLWVFLLALGPQVVGHSALNWALRYLSATFVTIAVLGEPIGATLLAWWLLGEVPSGLTIAGGVLILGGILFASRVE